MLRLIACKGYKDIDIHIKGRYVAASYHFVPIKVYIKVSETAPNEIIHTAVTNIVTLITFYILEPFVSYHPVFRPKQDN